MKKRRILIDCDGVMANFLAHGEDWLREILGDRLPPKNEIVYHDCFAMMTKAEEGQFWKRVDTTPKWVRSMPEISGTSKALAQLRELGEVVCVTSPHTGPFWVPERFAWLQSRGFTKKTTVFTGGKGIADGDILIDDHPDHITAWAAEHLGKTAVLRVHPEFAPVSPDIWPHQVSSWDEIISAAKRALQ